VQLPGSQMKFAKKRRTSFGGRPTGHVSNCRSSLAETVLIRSRNCPASSSLSRDEHIWA